MVRNMNCTVEGQNLLFLYTIGGIDAVVTVEVTDGRTKIDRPLVVHVDPRNDAPIVHTISPRGFIEDEAKTIDLTPYIEDEDTPLADVTMSCDHPSVVDISGYNMTLLYSIWVAEHEIEFSVSDGYLSTGGSFLVQVQENNDPPFITGIGDLSPPYVIEMAEGSVIILSISVEDEDDHNFRYSLESSWDSIQVFPNGTIKLFAQKGDINTFFATIVVEDNDGSSASTDLTVKVIDINDPPSSFVFLNPINHSIVEEGTNVSFSISVLDPDTILGQELTVTWISNISGILQTKPSSEPLEFVMNTLAVGEHRITVQVTDGEYEIGGWSVITVLKKPTPQIEDEPSLFTESTGIIAIVIVIVLVALIALGFIITSRKKHKVEQEMGAGEPSPSRIIEPSTDIIEVTDAHSLGLTSLIPAHSVPVATRDDGPGNVPEMDYQPPYIQEAVPPDTVDEPDEPPTELELQARAHATQVREVMKALTQLPRGLPTVLWDKDLSRLAKEIVEGPRRTTPDGTVIVQLEGHWFTADVTKVGTFMREWKDKEPMRTADTIEDNALGRAMKLEQLDERLLEGTISEATYKRLMKKYEN